MKIKMITATLAVVLGTFAGCANISKEQGGTSIGAIVGGVVGSQIGSGKTRALATVLGVGAGALIGNRIGKYLDDQDKQKLANATIRTAETDETQSVVSQNSGTTMQTSTVSPSAAQPSTSPTGQVATNTGGECKTVRQAIVLKDGTRQQEDVKVCRGADGWEVMGS